MPTLSPPRNPPKDALECDVYKRPVRTAMRYRVIIARADLITWHEFEADAVLSRRALSRAKRFLRRALSPPPRPSASSAVNPKEASFLTESRKGPG